MQKTLFLLTVLIMNIALDSQKYVAVDIKNKSVEVENGKTFLLLVNMKPATGIHINLQPPISVKPLDKETTLSVKEVPRLGEYLNPSKPIKVECQVDDLNVGIHNLQFAIGYTYCSEKDGWCRMGNDTISVSLHVKK